MKRSELKEYLDAKFEQYNNQDFIPTDPIQLVHRFDRKEDIEIVGLLVATIAWGKREMIIRSGEKMLSIMGDSPFEFVTNYTANALPDFVHRTFNANDLDFFFRGLQSIYQRMGSLENAFHSNADFPGVKGRIVSFRNEMLKVEHEKRSEKHLSDPSRGSAAKRLNMYLRWMVRNDNSGVDFGIWESIPSSELMIPLDVHTARVARDLKLLKRKQNDWKALEEIMGVFRKFDQNDPAKYDFSLFGIGAFE
ncbi:MAG: TIGR02757 family protein [Crocinitomicaceae bacterium]